MLEPSTRSYESKYFAVIRNGDTAMLVEAVAGDDSPPDHSIELTRKEWKLLYAVNSLADAKMLIKAIDKKIKKVEK